ncbi:MAG: hypothetical protein WCV85_06420 [Patescibacteria group bacterium]
MQIHDRDTLNLLITPGVKEMLNAFADGKPIVCTAHTGGDRTEQLEIVIKAALLLPEGHLKIGGALRVENGEWYVLGEVGRNAKDCFAGTLYSSGTPFDITFPNQTSVAEDMRDLRR